ncbi:UDP-N-acetylmuramoyl-L-alanyl-D-glutamate--2,6-diaminopimelate ligase [Isoptericola variabilis]|uniref:UDP-N-acetylmuramyl-tripeptide synthetase n=1 Tax=Isoptericola variabilis (strain 225) TaxID=743718 RepID=F6FSI7_ISOV2|nr:UDP-N-acetylmuramoyl-L-alanyl-D-glutamate--2,6-diaminopimelate ligase [Isoptericola variabilis]AEG44054.1 UDP-N-acetylmuramoyl-L-alanyl-D-glutamate--2,6-diaminopimelate ligase [Isoptericola variabilis 225]TWH31758.1 UDP-N-acetylmuramoylalanyl-D-glutamate--2,6-diaminopimelate ligase [Isoptericola variabilis J7]
MTSPLDRFRPTATRPRRVRDLALTFGLETAATGPDDVTVTSVVSDNRLTADGDLFVALAGSRAHGARFAADAVARGARAVLTDAEGARLLGDALAGVPVLVAPDPRAVLGAVAAWVYGSPAERLMTFGVTGTNGKTTTTYQIDHLLRALGWKGGLVGTVEMRSGDRVLASRLTTPEAADLQALLATMVEDEVRTLAMEVSSHALALHRVDGIEFGVVGFTNLSQDHLDFHGDLQAYFDTKALLFTPARARRGVVVVDDAWGERMADAARIPVATLRTRPARDGEADADWTVSDVVPHGTGSAFTLTHADGRTLRTSTSLPGGFNVANAALAAVMVLEGGAHLDDVREALDAAGGLSATVPGRMEVVGAGGGGDPRVVVDFAHNTDALELALDALRPTTAGRLVVVFGATGDRDAGKRPAMGAAAVSGADVVVVTDDDPHGEDPAAIRAEVLGGARAARDVAAAAGRSVEVLEVAPRAEAIRRAVLDAGPDDTVLVAGRGHETIQEVAGVDLELDDRVEARRALATRHERTTTA